MTTIVYDGKKLAVDSQITDGEIIWYRNKLWKWKKGVFSVAGDWGDYPLMRRYLNGYKGEDLRKKFSKHFECYYSEEGKLYSIDKRFEPMWEEEPVATGSGFQIATSGLQMGLSAIEAVKLACQLNPNTGGKVRWVHV